MDCCGGGNKNAGNAHAGHAAGEEEKGISWAQIFAIGVAILFLAGIFFRR